MAAGFSIKIAGDDLGAFLPGRIDLKAAFAIKATSGLTPVEVTQGVATMDPDALQVMAWFLSTHDYDKVNRRYSANGKNVDASTINFALDDIETEAIEDDAPKSPPAPPTSRPDETDTSSS